MNGNEGFCNFMVILSSWQTRISSSDSVTTTILTIYPGNASLLISRDLFEGPAALSVNDSRHTSGRHVLQRCRGGGHARCLCSTLWGWRACSSPASLHTAGHNGLSTVHSQVKSLQSRFQWGGDVFIAFLHSKSVNFLHVKPVLTKWSTMLCGHAEPGSAFPHTGSVCEQGSADRNGGKMKWLLPEKINSL